jgi:type I restriction enzyme S subunit
VRSIPLKYLVEINRETLDEYVHPGLSFRYIDIGTVGRGTLVGEVETMTFAEAPSRARRVARAGDTLISTVRTYLRAVLFVRSLNEMTVASTGFAVLTPGPSIDPRFLGWLSQSDAIVEQIVARSVGVSYPAINPAEIGEIKVPAISLARQRAIADSLDAETTRIDALIAKKRELLRVLAEQLRSAAERTILGSDEADSQAARMQWFESVPTGWIETTLRHMNISVQTGPFGSQLHADDYVPGGWPIVNPADLSKGEIVANTTATISGEKRLELSRHVLRLGDIVLGRRGEMGRTGIVRAEHVGWLCGTGSLRMRISDDRLLPQYLNEFLQTVAVKRYLGLASVGSTMENLSAEILMSAPLLAPPVDVQHAILRKLDSLKRRHAALAARLEKQTRLLTEHRQALITAAVTGELEIPSAA